MSNPPSVYRCTQCGVHGHWGVGWLWYGNYIHGPSKILCPKCSIPHLGEVIA